MVRRLTLSLVVVAVAVLACSPGQAVPSTPVGDSDAEAMTDQAVGDLAYYCSALTDSDNQYYGTDQRPSLVRKLDNPDYQTHDRYVEVRLSLAEDMLRFGETREAIEVLQGALDAEERDDPERAHLAELWDAMAVTYLKMGDLDNCLRPGGDLICTLPLDRNYVHTNTNGSRKAIEYLLRLLELSPDDVKYMCGC